LNAFAAFIRLERTLLSRCRSANETHAQRSPGTNFANIRKMPIPHKGYAQSALPDAHPRRSESNLQAEHHTSPRRRCNGCTLNSSAQDQR
jgi:hypothetical protein